MFLRVVLASTLVGSDVDAGSSRGCESGSSDDAGRVSACAERSAEETPDERCSVPTTATMTGTVSVSGTYRTVGSFSIRFRGAVGLRVLPLKRGKPSRPLTQTPIGGCGGSKTSFVNTASFSPRRPGSRSNALARSLAPSSSPPSRTGSCNGPFSTLCRTSLPSAKSWLHRPALVAFTVRVSATQLPACAGPLTEDRHTSSGPIFRASSSASREATSLNSCAPVSRTTTSF
jgi:hypothetical protein